MRSLNKCPVVVITGASAGIGRATVRRFAREGARLGLVARGMDGLKAAQEEVVEAGSEALILQTDVAKAAQVEAAAEEVENTFGPIDIWINNAMTSVFSPFKEMRADEFHRVTEVTYLGVVYGTMAALKRMLPRDRGTVIQVGSALAYRSIPLQSAYCGAKHAIRGFTDSLRCELKHDKSRVQITMVQLPGVNTTQFGWVKNRLPRQPKPIGKVYQPEVAADAIYGPLTIGVANYTSARPRANPSLPTRLLPDCWMTILAASVTRASRRRNPKIPSQPTTCGGQFPETMGRMASLMPRPWIRPLNYGLLKIGAGWALRGSD